MLTGVEVKTSQREVVQCGNVCSMENEGV